MCCLPPSFFDHFEDRLNLAVYDINAQVRSDHANRQLRAVLNELESGMGLKLQGLAAKYAKLEHIAELEAEKLDARVEEVTARVPGVFSGAHATVDSMDRNIGDIATAFTAIESVTNGGPKIEAPLPPLAPGAPH